MTQNLAQFLFDVFQTAIQKNKVLLQKTKFVWGQRTQMHHMIEYQLKFFFVG